MSILAQAFGGVSLRSQRSRAEYDRLFLSGEDFDSRLTLAGEEIDEFSALQVTWVFKCVSVISKTIASLPLHIYRRLDRGRERANTHRLARLLGSRPNRDMTSLEFRRGMEACKQLWGQAFALIWYSAFPTGAGYELLPMRPDRMRVERDKTTGLLKYRYQTANAGTMEFSQDQILHVRDLTLDGVNGLSRIAYARECLGGAKATEKFGSKLFSSGARFFGALKHPGTLGEDGQKNLRDSMRQQYEQGLLILEEGMDWESIGIPPEDAQFLETKKFQAEDIVSLFEIPPHKVGIMDKATFSNIEQQAIEWVTDSILPICANWEQRLENTLFEPADVGKYEIRFQLNGLLRGDSAARGEFYMKQFQCGAISPNEIAELEDRNPVDGGDRRFVQVNMFPLDSPFPIPQAVSAPITKPENKPDGDMPMRGLIESHRAVFSDVLGRIIRKERAAMKGGRKPDARTIRDGIVMNLPPVVRTCGEVFTALGMKTPPPGWEKSFAETFADGYLSRSKENGPDGMTAEGRIAAETEQLIQQIEDEIGRI